LAKPNNNSSSNKSKLPNKYPILGYLIRIFAVKEVFINGFD